MRQVKARCYVCVDENGNLQIVGTSKPTPENKLITLVSDGMEKEGITVKTFHFEVNVPVPDHDEGIVENG